MKKFKKALALSLALAMGLSLVACGDEKDDKTTDNKTTEDTGSVGGDATGGDATGGDAAEGIAAPSTDGWDDSKKIYVSSWDDDFIKKLQVVLDAFPEYKDYVELNVQGVSGTDGTYQTNIDTLLENGGATYPSLIPADNDVAKYFSEDDSKTLDLYSIGFTKEMLEVNYDYAKQYGTYNDQLKCVTWQACPGSVFYRRDIAKDVLGTDDPEAIQAEMKDWDSFFALADKLKEKNYKIVSGPDIIKYAVWDSQTQPWVNITDDSETLALDDTVSQYLELAKKLYDGDYTNNAGNWSADGKWATGMTVSDGDVFCYFGCPWFVGSMKDAGAEDGVWGAVVGPTSYHWGGTYVCVGKDTPNPELCAFLLYELTCDPDISVKIANTYGDAVNNKVANERLTTGELSQENAALKFLNGQNPYEVWADAAAGYNASNVTYADSAIKLLIDDASTAYNEGTYDLDEAIQSIKDKAESELGLASE